MPFAQVRPLVADLQKAQALARQGNIELLAGDGVRGKAVRLRGELTDANCYLTSHDHAYDHAFCAKLCVAAGSPLIFLSDQDSQLYFVLTGRNAVAIRDDILDSIGVPGITIRAKTVSTNNVRALAIDEIDKPSHTNQH